MTGSLAYGLVIEHISDLQASAEKARRVPRSRRERRLSVPPRLRRRRRAFA